MGYFLGGLQPEIKHYLQTVRPKTRIQDRQYARSIEVERNGILVVFQSYQSGCMVRKVMPDQVLQLRLVEAKIVLGQGQTQISTNLAKIKEIHLWHSQVEEQRVNSEIQQRAIMACAIEHAKN